MVPCIVKKSMFDRAGLKCTSLSRQIKGASREYTLNFVADEECAKQQQSMAKLVKLGIGYCDIPGSSTSPWARRCVHDFMRQLSLDDYAAYVRQLMDYGDNADNDLF